MMRKNNVMRISLLAAFFILIGCGQPYKVPDYSLLNRSGESAVEKKIDMRVGFVQDEALKNAKMNIIGYEYEEGRLAKNTNELAALLFKDVTIVDVPRKTDDFEAYLTPRLVRTAQVFAGHDKGIVANVFFEWKLEDRDQNLIWVDTIKAEEAPVTWRQNEDIAYRGLLDDLFKKSIEAIKSSPEIATFVNRRSPRNHGTDLQTAEEQESVTQPSEESRSKQVPAVLAKLSKQGTDIFPKSADIVDLTGDWDVYLVQYGPGQMGSSGLLFPAEAKIVQKNNDFDLIATSVSYWFNKGTVIMRGLVSKKSITIKDIYNRDTGGIQCQVDAGGKKIECDNGKNLRITCSRK